jgi:hypothetical protein
MANSSSSTTGLGARLRLAPGFGVRLGRGLGLGIAAVYVLMAAILLQQADSLDRYAIKTDYVTTLTGAEIVLAGNATQLYNRETQAAVQPRLLQEVGYGTAPLVPFIHSPLERVLVVPVRALGLSYGASFAVWTALNLLALAGAVWALGWGWSLGPRLNLIGALGVVTFFPLYEALLTGQTAALMLLGGGLGGAALRRRYDGWAGVGFAIALVKPQALLLVLLVLFALRRWRALAAFAATAGGLLVVSVLLLGLNWPLDYLRLALSVGGYPHDIVLDPLLMQNWRGQASLLLGDNATANTVATGLSLVSLVALALLWWGRDRARWQPATPAWSRRWAGTLLIAMLTVPYLLPPDFALAIVPGWILAYLAVERQQRGLGLWVGAGWLVGLAMLSGPVRPLGIPIMLTVLWMVITVGWLLWDEFHAPAPAPSAALSEETGVVV